MLLKGTMEVAVTTNVGVHPAEVLEWDRIDGGSPLHSSLPHNAKRRTLMLLGRSGGEETGGSLAKMARKRGSGHSLTTSPFGLPLFLVGVSSATSGRYPLQGLQ